jgi:hypothetical protein
MELQLLERGALADSLLASCYLAVPGAGGSAPADPQPKPYSWTSLSPVHVPLPAGQDAAAVAAAAAAPAAAGAGGTAASYPAGTVFVRCGWVGDDAQGRRGGSGHALSSQQQEQQGQLALLEASRFSSYANPLASPRPGSPAAAAGGDAEAAPSLMPPQPHVALDRAVRRSAGPGGAGRANRQQLARWLQHQLLDPNDPRWVGSGQCPAEEVVGASNMPTPDCRSPSPCIHCPDGVHLPLPAPQKRPPHGAHTRSRGCSSPGCRRRRRRAVPAGGPGGSGAAAGQGRREARRDRPAQVGGACATAWRLEACG